jgi:hypothetical protein
MDHEKRFGEGPGSGEAGLSVPASLMDLNWCGLPWTPWAALERQAIRQIALKKVAGVYRVRRKGDGPTRLTYIGQTGHGLRERLLSLAVGVNAKDCPFNDPHTAAPHLWLLRRFDAAEFAISCAPVPGKVQVLRGTEDMLLWRHRIKTGLFTEANSGRFYPGCARSTNRWIVRKGARAGGRTPGRIAQPLPAGVAPPDFGLVTPPVQGDRGVLRAPWWQRESLADGPSIPSNAGVYRIYFLITRDVVRGKRGRLNTEYSGFEDKLYLLPERSGEWKDQPETILQPAPPGLNFSTCDGLTRTVAIKSVS